MTNIIIKVRDIVGDLLLTNGNDIFDYISSAVFVLTSPNVDSTSVKVYKNGVLVSAANYTYDNTTVTLTYTGTLLAGDIIRITYSYYTKYSDNELRGYIRSALYYLTIAPYKTFVIRPPAYIFPTPTEAEESLIAIAAGILMKGNIKSYRTPEISIVFGEEGNSASTITQKIKQLVHQFVKAYGVLEYMDPNANLYTEPGTEL